MLHISPGFQGRSQNPDRTGSDRIDKTWIGLRPIDKKRTGSEQNQIATMISLKWLRDSSIEMAEEEVCRCDLAQTSKSVGGLKSPIFVSKLCTLGMKVLERSCTFLSTFFFCFTFRAL